MSYTQVRGKYTQEYKLEAVRQVKAGQSIAVTAKVLGIPKVSLSAKCVLSGAGDKPVAVTAEQMELARLHAGHTARYAWINQMRKQFPVSIACEVLEVSASGYFTWARQHKANRTGAPGPYSDEAWIAHMRAIHALVKQEYGWPRMHKELLARAVRVGKERMLRLMKQHGIRAKTKRKFVVTTDSKHNLPVAPDLVQRQFNPEAPNQIWSGDITYIATDEGWVQFGSRH